jgi:hypothetical protein
LAAINDWSALGDTMLARQIWLHTVTSPRADANACDSVGISVPNSTVSKTSQRARGDGGRQDDTTRSLALALMRRLVRLGME